MIVVRTPIGLWETDLLPGETVQDVLLRFKAEKCVHFASHASELRETQTGRLLPPGELLVDERYYYLTALLVAA